ncbi:uncharacterized protein LOC62_07G009376 [Vanrija pseudolonga]|uniref:Uncharacterized protein n=1 Tax=Vanrija pseudolonga TaxID=143232 RepID=A0AAF1BQ14_9TREE|nr:hypothetical protein LOC62_07G009376 [Vanrija pseudolonga]
MLRTLRTLAKHTPKPAAKPPAPSPSPTAAKAKAASPSSSAQQPWLPSTKRPKGAPEQPYIPAPRATPPPTPTPSASTKPKRAAEPNAKAKAGADARARAEAVLQARRDAGAAKTDRTRGLVDSFRALTPNSRIILGLGFAAVGVAGLAWDSTYDGAEKDGGEGEGEAGAEKPVISVRMVDRK